MVLDPPCWEILGRRAVDRKHDDPQSSSGPFSTDSASRRSVGELNTKLANPLRRSPISFYAATTGGGDDFLVFEYRSVVTRTTSYVFDALLGAAWNCSMLTMRFQIPNPLLWPWRVCQLNNNRPSSARAVNSWYGRALVRCAICDVCHCVARSCRLGTSRGTSHGRRRILP